MELRQFSFFKILKFKLFLGMALEYIWNKMNLRIAEIFSVCCRFHHSKIGEIFSEISVKYDTHFGGLYYVNGNATATPTGGRTLMLGDTRGVAGGQYALGRTEIANYKIPGPVSLEEGELTTTVAWLFVKKDC